MNTISQLSKYALQELKDSYPVREITALCEIIYMDIFHFTKIDIHLRKNEILEESFVNKFTAIILQLREGHPIQYILGDTEFCSLKFKVAPSTLIPRPETAELVNWIKADARSGQSLLDIGTGSGCIAITLAHACPGIRVSAIDISEQALQVAVQNSTTHHTQVKFRQADILNYENYPWDHYDLIVSNPPYIRNSEKAGMAQHILDHEPHEALFVPDDDPLLFYRRIAEFGQTYLNPGGKLYFEINEAMGEATRQLLQQHRYRNIELRQDLSGRDRMIAGAKGYPSKNNK